VRRRIKSTKAVTDDHIAEEAVGAASGGLAASHARGQGRAAQNASAAKEGKVRDERSLLSTLEAFCL